MKLTATQLKAFFRTVIKVVAGGPAIGTPGSNRAAGMLAALDTLANFADGLLADALTLADAQALATAGNVVPNVLYAIAGTWNAGSVDATVYVLGLMASDFAPTGWELNTGLVSVDVAAGTWKVFGVDAYTKAQTDTLLATKQGAILKQVYQGWPFNSAVLNLTNTSFNRYLRLDTQTNSTLNLPTPASTDVGKLIALWHYGRSANLTLLVQAKYTNGVKPIDADPTMVLPLLPYNYVAELMVVSIDRGTPYNDTVPGYAVVALSLLDTQATVTLAQLATVATTLPITAPQTSDYTLALSDAGCVVPISSSNNITVTVPDASAVAFAGPVIIYVRRKGTGKVLLQAGSANVIIQSRDGLHVDEADEVSLHLEQPNLWYMKGGVS